MDSNISSFSGKFKLGAAATWIPDAPLNEILKLNFLPFSFVASKSLVAFVWDPNPVIV